MFRTFIVVVTANLAIGGSIAFASDPSDIPPSIVVPTGVNSRYQFRVADWLWSRPEFSGFVNAKLREEVEAEIRQFESLRGIDGDAASAAFDALEEQIAGKLSRRFAPRDFTAGNQPLINPNDGTSLVLIVDPKFTSASQQTLQKAAHLFLQVGTRTDVIQSAIDDSIAAPTPQPEMYELKDGQPVLDKYGTKVYSAEYQFFRQSRVLPPSAEFVRSQLKDALPNANGDTGLLVISQYTGNVWWGGGFYGSYYNEHFRLKREIPSRGYLYIRLNEDKMQPGVNHHDDPAFWAGKIAHEILHNFSYWHPNYEDPEQRDQSNPPGKKAFIYAYEQAVAVAAATELSR
jgi:hypothetical protein